MKRWLTAAELAGLPGMAISISGVIRAAKRDRWLARDRAGRGGGVEYSIDSLPTITRQALIGAAASACTGSRALEQLAGGNALAQRAQQLIGEQTLQKLATLDGWKKEKTDLRLELWLALERHKADSGCSWEKAVEAWNAGAVQVDERVRAFRPRLSWPTFERMRAKVNKHGLAGLAPQYGNRKGDTLIERTPAVRDYLIGLRVEFPHAAPAKLLQALRTEFQEQHELPTEHQVRVFVKSFEAKHNSALLAATNPDDWKNRRMAAPGKADEDVVRLNQRWEIDSTPADVMCVDGRCSVICCIDVYSRRMKLLVSRTSKGEAIGLLLRRCILEWGVPEDIVTDRGRDYLSKYVLGIFKSLGIKHVPRGPFMPWKKPHVERGIGTFSRSVVVEMNTAFLGHSVEQRQAIESRQSFAERLFKKDAVVPVDLTEQEFQKLCDGWTDTIYLMEEHGSLGCSPYERASSWTGEIRRIENARALDLLLLPVPDNDGIRTVQKKGISVDGAWYYMPDFNGIVGDQVKAFYDRADMGLLYVYALDDGSGEMRYLGQAGNPDFAGISHGEFLEALADARRDANDDLAARRRELKRLGRGTNKREIVGKVLEQGRARTNRIAHLPRPNQSQPHSTPALEAAAQAAADNVIRPPVNVARATVLQGPRPPEKSKAQEISEKFDRALQLQARVASGEQLDAETADWLRRFTSSGDYRVEARMRAMQEKFKAAM